MNKIRRKLAIFVASAMLVGSLAMIAVPTASANSPGHNSLAQACATTACNTTPTTPLASPSLVGLLGTFALLLVALLFASDARSSRRRNQTQDGPGNSGSFRKSPIRSLGMITLSGIEFLVVLLLMPFNLLARAWTVASAYSGNLRQHKVGTLSAHHAHNTGDSGLLKHDIRFVSADPLGTRVSTMVDGLSSLAVDQLRSVIKTFVAYNSATRLRKQVLQV